MAHAVEEEEFGDYKGLDEHREACTDAGEEGNDVHDTDDVEDDVAWSRQGFLALPERHVVGDFRRYCSWKTKIFLISLWC